MKRTLYVESEAPIVPVPIAERDADKAEIDRLRKLLRQTDDLVGWMTRREWGATATVRCRRRLWPLLSRLPMRVRF